MLYFIKLARIVVTSHAVAVVPAWLVFINFKLPDSVGFAFMVTSGAVALLVLTVNIAVVTSISTITRRFAVLAELLDVDHERPPDVDLVKGTLYVPMLPAMSIATFFLTMTFNDASLTALPLCILLVASLNTVSALADVERGYVDVVNHCLLK